MTEANRDALVHPDPRNRSLPQEFEAFFELKQLGYLRYAHTHLRSMEDARRAVKVAGLRLVLQWSSILGRPDYEAEALRIVREVVRNYWQLNADGLVLPPVGQDQAAQQIALLARRKAVDRAWEELELVAPEHADCLRLRTARLSYVEVAQALGITTAQARQGTWMGMRTLRDLLDRTTDQHDKRTPK